MLDGDTFAFDSAGDGTAQGLENQEQFHNQEEQRVHPTEQSDQGGNTSKQPGGSTPKTSDEGAKPIYRGTSHANEIAIQSETGLVMSDAAREAYSSARYEGQSVKEAIQAAQAASETADQGQMKFWGDRESYVQAHLALS